MSDMIRVDVDHMSWRSEMPVSAAVRSGDVVFVSGQVGCDAAGAVISPGDVTVQAHQVFEGLAQVLAAVGGSLEDIVDLVSFHSDPREIKAAFEVGRGYLPEGAYPVWTPIGVLGSYSSEIRLVVRAIACLGDSRKQCVPMVNAAEDTRLPVSAACLKNDLLFATDFTAGVVPEDERGAPEAQTRRAHQRIATALAALGGSLDDILDIISFHQDPRAMVAGETAHLETFADTALDQAPAWTAIGTPALYGFGRLCQYRVIADLHEGPRIAQTPEGLHWKHQPISGGTRKPGGRLIGIAGEVSSDGEGNIIAPGDTGGQARYAFDRIQEVVEMHGGSLDDVVEVTAFHKDVRAWHIVVEVAREYFRDDARPAWTSVGTTGLWNPGYLHEIHALAMLQA